jgi:glycosyltransferase involved in cell wall biosynthesis
MNAAANLSFVVDEFPAARRSLRIAVVTETYPPEVNGVAMTVARVVQGLRGLNHDIQLLRPRQAKGEAPGQEQGFEEVLMRGLPIPRYPHLKMGIPSKKALVEMWSLRRPDVVHIATEGPLGWSALQAAIKLKLPVTSDFRTNFHAYSRHYGMGWLSKPIVAYLRKFHNRCAATMVPTQALAQDLANCGFKQLRVVARGVDAQRFSPEFRSEELRQQWGLKPGERAVLCVGRLAGEKNLDALLLAFEAMKAKDPALKLVLVGDGPLRKDLAQRCPQAVFCGFRTGHALAVHYASADLFVFPSLTETFGNVTPEAMASGLPVLAFDYAAASQLIESQRSGLLAPFGNLPEFIRLAEHLAEHPLQARQMGWQARQTALSMDWERIVCEVEEVLLQAIGQHEAAQPVLMRTKPAGHLAAAQAAPESTEPRRAAA